MHGLIGRRRSICNFLVNSSKGTIFLSSINTFDISKIADKVFAMLDDIVEMVGEENVVQLSQIMLQIIKQLEKD